MKSVLLIFSLFLLINLSAQIPTTCAQMQPICTGSGLTFTAEGSGTIESGNDYDCLFDQPAPSWYYFEIATAGPINMSLTAGSDIDYIIWGPFSSLSQAQSSCGNLTNVVDCSFDPTSSELPSIPSALVGEVYVMLITNFSQVTQTISLLQTGGLGSTDCSIITPFPCNIDALNAVINPCDPDNTFSISGDFSYTNNPGVGALIVEVDNGTGTFTQTFSPPFIDGQVYNFNIAGIPSNGANSTITVYFSNDPSCFLTLNYVATEDCSCAVELGTFTQTIGGQSTQDVVLCYGDTYDVESNGDFIPAEEQFSPPGSTYDPGIGWLVYSCPPTIGTNPSQNQDINNDPCFIGVLTFNDLSEVNDQYWMTTYPGVFTNNIVYFVPLSFYSAVEINYSYTNTSSQCFEMGTPYAVQYLPELIGSHTEDCTVQEVTATFSGGQPAIDGSNFTVVAGTLSPTTAVFVNTSCGNGGQIVLGNVNVGDTYSFDVADANGCTFTITGTMQGSGVATLTYPQSNYCIDETNPNATVTGLTGGTFSSTTGLSLNTSTGQINLASSTSGTYTVTYVAPSGICPPVSSFTITIHALPNVNAGPDQTICEGATTILSGSGASSYTWDNGITNGVTFSPVGTQTYSVIGTSAAGCQNTDQVVITILALPIPIFNADITTGCVPLRVTFSNSSGGSLCNWNFGDGNSAIGCGNVTHVYQSAGCFDITLTTQLTDGCSGTTTLSNYICVNPTPNAQFTAVPSVLSDLNPSTQMLNTSTNANSYEWNFGDSTTSTLENPSHLYPTDNGGSFSIQLIAISEFGCRDTAYTTIIINEEIIYYVPNSFTPDNDEFNQTFQPVFTKGFDPFDFNMMIYNRWGEVIFETNNAEIGWDGTYHGKVVKEGAFTWKIEFKVSSNDERKTAVGHVNILR